MKWKYHKNMCFISAIQKDVLIKTKSIALPVAQIDPFAKYILCFT